MLEHHARRELDNRDHFVREAWEVITGAGFRQWAGAGYTTVLRFTQNTLCPGFVTTAALHVTDRVFAPIRHITIQRAMMGVANSRVDQERTTLATKVRFGSDGSCT